MKHNKSILFVGAMPPQFGGISAHLDTLLPDLAHKGCDVISLSPANFDSEIYDKDFRNIHINLKKHFIRNILPVLFLLVLNIFQKKALPLRDFISALSLAHKISQLNQSESFDHIFFYGWKNSFCIPYLQGDIKNFTKLHMFIFGALYEYPSKYKKLKSNIKIICDTCDKLYASSKYCAEGLSKIVGLNYPVSVIYVGVDTDIYNPDNVDHSVKQSFDMPKDSILIVFFGRMMREMGLEVVLENVNKILNIDPRVFILIAGARNELSDTAKSLSEENYRIKYWENVPQSQKPSVFAAADILIAPTKDLRACMGVSIKEAMAFGKPVLASSSGGIPEAISEDDETGLILQITDGVIDSDELIKKLSRVINDGELRNRISVNARLKAETLFSTEIVLKRYKKIIDDS